MLKGAGLFTEMRKEKTDFIEENWFAPEKFYAKGFPKGIAPHLKDFPAIVKKLKELVRSGNFKNALEIGPGKQPVIKGVPNPIFLDASKFFLKGKAISRGEKILGRIEQLPFKDNSFDLVIENDVLSNVLPKNRVKALNEMARVSRGTILVFEYEIRDKMIGAWYPRDLKNPETIISLKELKEELMPKAGIAPLVSYKYNSKAISKINKKGLLVNMELIFAIKGRQINQGYKQSNEGAV